MHLWCAPMHDEPTEQVSFVRSARAPASSTMSSTLGLGNKRRLSSGRCTRLSGTASATPRLATAPGPVGRSSASRWVVTTTCTSWAYGEGAPRAAARVRSRNSGRPFRVKTAGPTPPYRFVPTRLAFHTNNMDSVSLWRYAPRASLQPRGRTDAARRQQPRCTAAPLRRRAGAAVRWR